MDEIWQIFVLAWNTLHLSIQFDPDRCKGGQTVPCLGPRGTRSCAKAHGLEGAANKWENVEYISKKKNPTVITALQYRNGPQVQSCGMDAKSLNTVRRPNENDFVVYVISTNLLYTTDFNDLGDKAINVRRGLCRRKKTSGCF